MLAITNATLVMHDHYIPDAVILIREGKIVSFGPAETLDVPENAQVLDVHHALVGPGFVDIHTHADDRSFFWDDPENVASSHLRQGTTTVLAATYMALGREELLSAIRTLRSAMTDGSCPNLAGLYMEGPYLNPKFGCDKEHCPWAGEIREEDYQPVIDAAWDIARAWSLAPERKGIRAFVDAVRRKNPNAVFTVAHSEAEPEEIEPLIPLGLRIGTHHTNATGTIQKYPEVRGVCVDEVVNYRPEIYAEQICDGVGIHVDPYMLRFVRKIKGDDRIILISDAYAADGPVPPGYDGVTDINFDHTGEIAGSKLTLNVACRNYMKHTGASPAVVFRMAAENPARAVGFDDRGRIAEGLRADLVVTDYLMNIEHVIMKGELLR